MRGVQRRWKQEERNERRAREWLQTGWDWQRRDGSIERERVGRRKASDSSTTGRWPLNDSLFLHDFNSWQSTGLLVASWQLYHYLLALSLLCILRLRWWRWRVGAMGFGGCGGWGRERESRLWGYSQNNWGRRKYRKVGSLVIVAVGVQSRTFNWCKFVSKVKENLRPSSCISLIWHNILEMQQAKI